MTGGYDDGYRQCSCFWGREPGSFVRRLTDVACLVGARVLDVGTGEGKNALYVRSHGAESVLALDVSELAVRSARRMHYAATGITWRVADVRTVTLPAAQFDVVIAYGLLHCLSDVAELMTVMRRLQAATRPGGYHVICAFNNRAQRFNGAHSGFKPLLIGHEDYVKLYDSWEVLAVEDADLHEAHPHELIPHDHSVTRLLGKKRGDDDAFMP